MTGAVVVMDVLATHLLLLLFRSLLLPGGATRHSKGADPPGRVGFTAHGTLGSGRIDPTVTVTLLTIVTTFRSRPAPIPRGGCYRGLLGQGGAQQCPLSRSEGWSGLELELPRNLALQSTARGAIQIHPLSLPGGRTGPRGGAWGGRLAGGAECGGASLSEEGGVDRRRTPRSGVVVLAPSGGLCEERTNTARGGPGGRGGVGASALLDFLLFLEGLLLGFQGSDGVSLRW